MKKELFKRGSALVLAVSMALTLGACGERGGGSRRGGREEKAETQAVQEETLQETAAAQTATNSDGTFATDSVVLSHTEHNQSLLLKEAPPVKAKSFHLYMDNTASMEGFVRKMTHYQTCMQAILGSGYNMFDDMTAHYMVREAGSQGLNWTQEKIEHGAFRKVYTSQFYKDNMLPETGTLATLFRKDSTPFEQDSLTVFVSTFLSQSFNMHVLAEGIEQYFDNNPGSAAAVLGMRSDFLGRHYIPMEHGEETTFFVDNFTEQIPFYVVTVGPEAEVRNFMEKCTEFIDLEDVPYHTAVYTNSVYSQIKTDPLSFDLLPDHKAKKAEPPILSSYNCGELSDNDHGNAFFSTFSSITTRAAKGRHSGDEENSVDVGRTTQMALMSRNYDGSVIDDWNVRLYRFDEATSQWVDAGQSANDMVQFRCVPVNGKIVDEISGETVLTEGRQELYMTAVLNFAEDSALSRDNVYRLQVSTNLNRQNPEIHSEAKSPELQAMSVETTDYYSFIPDLCTLGHGNYVWTGTSPVWINPKRKAEATALFARTPNLDVLLNGLERLENKYHPDEQRIQYFDFLFNLPDANSRR